MKTLFSLVAVTALALAACDDDDNDNGGTRVDTRDDSGGTRGDSRATETGAVTRVDIVADRSGAMVTDETLVNAWGLAFNPAGVAWVAAAETGWAEVYDAAGQRVIPPVAIPDPDEPGERAEPTGQVFNADANAFAGDIFILVTEDGTVAGWQQSLGEEAATRVDNSASGAVYKGAAIVQAGDGRLRLLAADFRGRKVDVFDDAYQPLADADAFIDPDIPEEFAPFNVEVIDDAVLVTYALQDDDGDDDVPGVGNGYVSLFDADGAFQTRLVSEGELNSPWGATLTPDTFEAAPERLLIGNFGDGRILVYLLNVADSGEVTAEFEGPLQNDAGSGLGIDGLWALEFGPDAGGFSSNRLYFTAGPNDEEDGVFGYLESVATPTGGAGTGGTIDLPY